MPALAANALSLLFTAVANTVANRRFPFGVRGPAGLRRHHAQGLIVFGAALAPTLAESRALVRQDRIHYFIGGGGFAGQAGGSSASR